jgi:hypothetical protein
MNDCQPDKRYTEPGLSASFNFFIVFSNFLGCDHHSDDLIQKFMPLQKGMLFFMPLFIPARKQSQSFFDSQFLDFSKKYSLILT